MGYPTMSAAIMHVAGDSLFPAKPRIGTLGAQLSPLQCRSAKHSNSNSFLLS